MAFLYLFVSGLILQILPLISTNQFNCTLDKSSEAVIDILYERSDLAIYAYNDTEFVNFLIHDVEIILKVSSKINKNDIKIKQWKTDLEGFAVLKGDKRGLLTNCGIDLKKNLHYRKDIAMKKQIQILELTTKCMLNNLCDNLGYTEADDFIRAKIINHNFGKNSAMVAALESKYPKLDLPHPMDNKRYGLQTSVNLLIDFWIASLVSQMTLNLGIIELPNLNQTIPGVFLLVNEGYFELNNGTFKNLKYINRSKDVTVTNKGLKFSIEGGFQLKDAIIHFREYTLKYGYISRNGEIDINIGNIIFNIKIVMNFNIYPCKTSVDDVKSHAENITFSWSDDSFLGGMASDVANQLVNQNTDYLIQYIDSEIKEAIEKQFDKFNCELYRP